MLGLALIAAGVFGIKAFISARQTFGTQAALPFYSETAYAYSNGIFYYADGDKLIRYSPTDPEGATSMSLGTDNVSVAAGNGTAALYSGSAVQIIGADDFIDIGGQVLTLQCAKNHIAVLRTDSAGAGAVLVYAKDGTLVDVIEQGADIITGCGFYSSASGDTLWILTLSTSAQTPVTTLTTYNYAIQNGQSVATMSGVISVNSQLVDNVVFTGSSIFISGAEQLIRCDAGISGETWRLLTYGYKLADHSLAQTRPLFLFVPRADTAMKEVKLYTVDEAAQSSAAARTVQLGADIHSVIAVNGKMAAFSQSELYLYSAAGKLNNKYTLDFACINAQKLSESDIICEAADGSLWFIKLK